jgi:hypothetical protein
MQALVKEGRVAYARNTVEKDALVRDGYVEHDIKAFKKGGKIAISWTETQEHVFKRDGFVEDPVETAKYVNGLPQ